MPCARRRKRRRRSTKPWLYSAWMVLLAGTDPGRLADQALTNLLVLRSGVLTLHVQSVVLHLERQLVRVVMGVAASVGQPLHSTFLVAFKDLVAGLAGDSKLPEKIRHRLAG